MRYVVAIDLGTQSTRAAVVDQYGAVLALDQVKHDLDTPHPGWAQQRPDSWWQETCQTLRTVLRQAAIEPSAIAAVAACGQMHGPVGVDHEGKTTTPWVQLWADKRSIEQCESLLANQDQAELQKLSGNSVSPAWTGIKVRWEKDNDPGSYERTRWYLVPKDFINYRLSGVAAADPSEASCSFLYDRQNEAYSQRLADIVGVDLEKFAPVHRSQDVIGEVTEDASRQTGLAVGTPVVAGGGDFPVSMLGFGIIGDGVTADVTGTSTLVAAHTPKPLLHPAIQNCRHVVDGWIPFTILDSGGLSIKWCRDLVSSMRGEDISYDELIELAEQAEAGSDGLQFYPYMMGERRRENVAALGGYFGIKLDHRAPHFVRSVMEGVAFAMASDIGEFAKQGHHTKRLMSVGGGTRNDLWTRIKASVVQTQIELSDEPEAGLKGAAILASAGAGLISDPVQTAVERRAAPRIVQPDMRMAGAYQEAQAEYERIYDHMLGFWAK